MSQMHVLNDVNFIQMVLNSGLKVHLCLMNSKQTISPLFGYLNTLLSASSKLSLNLDLEPRPNLDLQKNVSLNMSFSSFSWLPPLQHSWIKIKIVYNRT